MSPRAAGLVLLALAALGWGLLGHTPLGAPVLEARGRTALARGDTAAAAHHLERAVALAPTGARWNALAAAYRSAHRPAEARRAWLRGTLARDLRVRRDAFHALSALYLEEASQEGPGTQPGLPAAAARAAMEGLRLDPGHPGLAWNLYLARRVGGFPEPEFQGSGMDPATERAVRAALASLEARQLRASLGAVLRALEEELPPRSTEGPPW